MHIRNFINKQNGALAGIKYWRNQCTLLMWHPAHPPPDNTHAHLVRYERHKIQYIICSNIWSWDFRNQFHSTDPSRLTFNKPIQAMTVHCTFYTKLIIYHPNSLSTILLYGINGKIWTKAVTLGEISKLCAARKVFAQNSENSVLELGLES